MPGPQTQHKGTVYGDYLLQYTATIYVFRVFLPSPEVFGTVAERRWRSEAWRQRRLQTR